MKTRLLHLWDILTTSYWFVPTLMVMAAAGVSIGLLVTDRHIQLGPVSRRWLYSGGAEGARSLLSTIAGSIITVAGVVFSITIATLTQASSQFGPRLLRNFMRDTGNQIVLGTFLGTFLYCLLVLRSVYGTDSGGFVPNLSITFGVLLAVASLGVLIYFIHHVSQSIQAPNVVANVGRELERTMHRLFPDALGHGAPVPVPSEAELHQFDSGTTVYASAPGYLQAIDSDGILNLATERDLRVRLLVRPGDFVMTQRPILLARSESHLEPEAIHALCEAFYVGSQRTQEQDAEYSIHQLVEIAVRALSPGINDPFTASTCVDWLGQAICSLCKQQFPTPWRYDEQGKLRVIAIVSDFGGMLDASFNQIRQYGVGSVAVTLRLLETLEKIAACAGTDQQRSELLRHAKMLEHPDEEPFGEKGDRVDLRQRFQAAMLAIGGNGNALRDAIDVSR
jgi:uncharacterized membrane protein